ncbi:unnamed protein product [Blepharisma stoltei]|uniref:Lysosomal Pro-X carboxypeptidase n=1 Tax=Blepharisma stoltei TaxID=1481888 RepID=A0AAU9IW34_9CILI|nr:unnamed protein product [Blepharisma stoltei]
MKWVFLVALSITLCSAMPRFPRIQYKMPEQLPPNYVQSWFTSFVDHFGSGIETFQMRYFSKNTYWTNNTQAPGPIFFYCGNEGAIEMFIENSGWIDQLASQMGAAVVYAEHRYFGQSMPFGNRSFTSPQNLKYLSPHQALGDYAYLLQNLKIMYYDAPVIAWGGSYGGMLAAWFRMKYPNLVVGAIASSAPIFHFMGSVNPEEFNEIVTNDYAMVDTNCVPYIKTAHDILGVWTRNSTLWWQLQEIFNTCTEVITYSTASNIINWIDNALTYMAMTDYPYETNFLEPMPANPVNVACSKFNNLADDATDAEILAAIRDAVNVYYNSTGNNTCNLVDQQYDNGLGDNGWDYLSCSTLVMPIGSDGVHDMFLPQPFSISAIDSYCLQTWGVAPVTDYAKIFYGSSTNPLGPLRYASNILFPNGSLDPWQSGGVLESIHANSVIGFIMQGAAHHLDLRTPNPSDPEDVVTARNTEKQLIKYWLATAK